MAFDPDAYLAEKQSFNPDAYLAEKTTEIQPQQPDPWYQKAADVERGVGNAIGQAVDAVVPDKLQAGYEAIKQTPFYKATPQGMIESLDTANRSIFNKAGQYAAEKIGQIGHPMWGAGVGTAVSMAPDIAMSFLPVGAEEAKPLSSIPKKILSGTFDVPEGAIASRYANPQAIQSVEKGIAPNLQQIASEKIPQVAKKFDQTISGLHDEAKKVLSTSRYLSEGAFTKDEVLGAVNSARTKLGGVYTQESQQAANTLSKIGQNLKKIRETVSQNQVHDLIKDIDNEIPWDKVWRSPETLTQTDKSMMDVRSKLDTLLKDKNTQYKGVMGPLSEQITNRNEFLKQFSMKKIRGGGYEPSDTTINKVKNATNENKLMTQRVLDKTSNSTGENLTPLIENAQTAEAFKPKETPSHTVFDAVRGVVGGPKTAAKIIDKVSPIQRGIDESRFTTIPALAGASKEISKKPKRIKQNGHTYILNEETGKYE